MEFEKPVRIIRSAVKHRWATKEQIMEVLANTEEPIASEPGDYPGETALTFIGPDDAGNEFKVVAIDQPNRLLVIHCHPVRRGQ